MPHKSKNLRSRINQTTTFKRPTEALVQSLAAGCFLENGWIGLG
jgi:hypothetical protein